jgi:hypothetical protein
LRFVLSAGCRFRATIAAPVEFLSVSIGEPPEKQGDFAPQEPRDIAIDQIHAAAN